MIIMFVITVAVIILVVVFGLVHEVAGLLQQGQELAGGGLAHLLADVLKVNKREITNININIKMHVKIKYYYHYYH